MGGWEAICQDGGAGASILADATVLEGLASLAGLTSLAAPIAACLVASLYGVLRVSLCFFPLLLLSVCQGHINAH